MPTVLWMLPLGLIIAFAAWRFFRGIGDRKRITPEDESNAVGLSMAAQDLHLH